MSRAASHRFLPVLVDTDGQEVEAVAFVAPDPSIDTTQT